MNYRAKEEEGDPSEINNGRKSSNISSSSRQWANFKNPRIVRVSRTFGGKDRHSKVCTVRGLRDRRIRLSVPTAIQLYDLQDRLGLSQPSKVVDWLLDATKSEIDKLPPLQMPPGGSFMNPHFFQPPLPLPLPATDTVSHHHHHSQEEKNEEEPFQEQNFFPLGNHEQQQQQQQQQPSFPFINPYYQHHLELPAAAVASYNLSLSQFGNQYSSFPIQLPPAAHEPAAAADHNSQLYFCPSAAPPPPPFPILNNNNIPPQYIMPPSGSGGPVEFLTSSSNTTSSSSNQNVVVQNSFMPTLHHLIGGGSPMMMKSSSLTLNVNNNNNNYYPKVILHPQETDSNRREKGEETGT